MNSMNNKYSFILSLFLIINSSCEVLFGYDYGREWGVSHYRFVKPGN